MVEMSIVNQEEISEGGYKVTNNDNVFVSPESVIILMNGLALKIYTADAEE